LPSELTLVKTMIKIDKNIKTIECPSCSTTLNKNNHEFVCSKCNICINISDGLLIKTENFIFSKLEGKMFFFESLNNKLDKPILSKDGKNVFKDATSIKEIYTLCCRVSNNILYI